MVVKTVKSRGKIASFAVILVLTLCLPLSVIITLGSIILALGRQRGADLSESPRNVLLTGGKMSKALQLARLLSRSGHKVTLVETKKYSCSGHAFSNCVENFHLIPSQSEGFDAYRKKLEEVIAANQISLVIPVASPTAVFFDAKLKKQSKKSYDIFSFEPEIIDCLDNKFALCQKALDLGLPAPEVFLIESAKQMKNRDLFSRGKRYILKCLSYDPVGRLTRPLFPFDGQDEFVDGLDISEKRPWVLQEFIEGQEFCTHTTAKNGEILLHCCCPSSEFQLRYLHVEHQKIFDWVSSFVSELKLTGQISFDFIQKQDGEVVPIECNPRTHSAITAFYNETSAWRGYNLLGDADISEPIMPSESALETYWLYHELGNLVTDFSIRKFIDIFKLFVNGKEALLDGKDPLPFLMVNHWQIPSLLLQAVRENRPWVRIDFNIGKLVEPGGD